MYSNLYKIAILLSILLLAAETSAQNSNQNSKGGGIYRTAYLI